MDRADNPPEILLCLDDHPERYRGLRLANVVFAVTHNPEDYAYYVGQHRDGLIKLVGVLLDHDMPLCDGQEFARKIREDLHVPVVLTSGNVAGCAAMQALLVEYEIPVLVASVTTPGWWAKTYEFLSGYV